MTRKHATRKHRPANPTSWAAAIAGSWDLPAEIVLKTMNLVRTAYQRMRDGNGEDADYGRIGGALNLGLIRAESIGQPVVEGIGAGINALRNADRIRTEHGRYGFTGPDILAMNCAVDLYEEILKNSTARQMQAAVDEEARRQARSNLETAA